MKPLPITEASDTQLREFAVNVLQLEGVPLDRPGIIAALRAGGHSDAHIFINTDTPPASDDLDAPVEELQLDEAQEVPAEMPASGFTFWTGKAPGKPPCPMVTLKVLSTDRPGGNEPAHPVINNSPPLVIQRNTLVRIPYDFYLVLRGAGGTALLPRADNKGMDKQDYREYPMEVLQMPTKRDVEAWNAWAGQQELGKPNASIAA